ncbi:YfcE family phosphodiesterase [Lactococcus hircilactis]|uniref:Phosphoesterase n=1 Tax=Lactococcus hircilactis TaxID=1494462 RepID=A0A7X1Z6I5_9LACT|nr:metallophosphoesterase [Lactococcus hircilactis]MQW38501.1 YfcE family phosphodiesterase [Lactococcus hircilactis]
MFVVMSDSHEDRDVIQKIKTHYQNSATAIFHCGDSELSSQDPIWDGITVVRGNCDDDAAYPNFLTQKVEGKKVLITHGHLYFVGMGLDSYASFAEQENADIALFGHIHQPVAQIINGILFLNPGSVAQPRGKYQVKMYAVIEINEGHFHVSYRDLNHQPINTLQFDL